MAVLQYHPSATLHISFYQSLSNHSLSLTQTHTLQFYLSNLAEIADCHKGVGAW